MKMLCPTGFSQRVFVGPPAAGHGLADCHRSARFVVPQSPAGKQWDLQRVEIVRRDEAPLNVTIGLATGWYPSWDVEYHVHLAPEWQSACQGSVFYTGNAFHTLYNLPSDAVHGARLGIPRTRERNLHCQEVARVKPKVHAVQSEKAPNQQEGAAQQHHGEGHFRGH